MSPGKASALRRRRLHGIVFLCVLLAIGALSSLAFGSRDIPLGEVPELFRQLLHALRAGAGDNVNLHVLADYRWPRTLLGIAVGAGIGVAGALIQGHTRNPLADPGILGIASGASLGVVLGFALLGLTSQWATSVSAFLGPAWPRLRSSRSQRRREADRTR